MVYALSSFIGFFNDFYIILIICKKLILNKLFIKKYNVNFENKRIFIIYLIGNS